MIDKIKNQKIWPVSFFERFCPKDAPPSPKQQQQQGDGGDEIVQFNGLKQDYMGYLDSIRMELTNLFNSFNVVDDSYFAEEGDTPPTDLDHPKNSNKKDFRYSAPFYGIRRLSSLYLEGELYHHIIEQELTKAIREFEPRIKDPDVTIKGINTENLSIFMEISGHIEPPITGYEKQFITMEIASHNK